MDTDAVRARPLRPRTEIVHQSQGQVDVGTRNDVSRQAQGQALGQYRPYHQQGGDVLRADIARQGHLPPFEPGARDAQGREPLLPGIFNPRPQAPQGLHQDADGALLHPGGAGQETGARSHTQAGCEETHRGARGADVHGVRRMFKGPNHDARVVAIAQVFRTGPSPGQGVEDENTVADAFRSGQLNGSLQGDGSLEDILHGQWLVVSD